MMKGLSTRHRVYDESKFFSGEIDDPRGIGIENYDSKEDRFYQLFSDDMDSPSLAVTEECLSKGSMEADKIPIHLSTGYPQIFCCSEPPSLPPPVEPVAMKGIYLSGTVSSSKVFKDEKFQMDSDLPTNLSICTDEKNLMTPTAQQSRPAISPSRTLRALAETLFDFLCTFQNPYQSINNHTGTKAYCMYCGQCGCSHCCISSEVSIEKNIIKTEINSLRKTLEFEIEQILGSSSRRAEECLEILRDWLCNNPPIAQIEGNKTDKLQGILLRNRRHVIHTYQKRIERLRNEMHFVSNTDYSPSIAIIRPELQNLIPITRSMDESLHRSPTENQSKNFFPNVTLSSPKKEKNSFNCTGTECVDISLSSISGASEKEDEFGYDSDPGVYRERYSVSKRASSFQFQTCRDTYNAKSPMRIPHSVLEGNSVFCISSSEEDSVKELDLEFSSDELVSNFIQELINNSVTLVHHPTPTEKNLSLSPVCVTAWFEMGSRLKEKVIQPKFMWRAAYQPDLSQPKPCFSCAAPDSIELLNIVRVLKPNSIDRNIHPFAKLQNSFVLQTNNADFLLFESHSETERDRFVHGLKLVVARLASKIIVGDQDVFEEFFTPWGGMAAMLGSDEVCGNSSISEEGSEMERKDIFRVNSIIYNK